jgi:hypothetical protein
MAALFKFTPIIFLPYFFFKNIKVFLSSVLTIAIGSVVLNVHNIISFFQALLNFAGNTYSSSIFSNGLFGVFYNRLTKELFTFSTSKSVFMVAALLIVAGFFYYLIKNIRSYQKASVSQDKNNVLTMMEFAFLLSIMILLPNLSWIYNGVYLLFMVVAYWLVRERGLVVRAQLWDGLLYLILAQPLLLGFFQQLPLSVIFALRPVYILIFFVFLFRVYLKLSKEIVYD